MQLRDLNIGCFGGGTGLPSLLGGLKTNPWLQLNAVVTMFDSGGSSGQLRDELGVLPPGDVLKCALALARNEGEARRVLLARLPTLEQHDRLAGHTGGNLLLSMMEQYSGDFLAAVDGLRGPARLPRPRVAGQRRAARRSASSTATDRRRAARWRSTRGRSAGIRCGGSGSSRRPPSIRSSRRPFATFDAVIIGPGSFFTSLMPPLLVRGVKEALARRARPDHPHRQPAHRGPRHGRIHRRPNPRAGCRAPSTGPSTS